MAMKTVLAFAIAAGLLWPQAAKAQSPEPNPQQRAVIRDCVGQKLDTEDGGESCIIKLVADPCIAQSDNSTAGMAECFHVEHAIWDAMLNTEYRELQAETDARHREKLRALQRAWIAARDLTCAFYHDKIQGTMAVTLSAACLVRETARRALLLRQFKGL
jgi:uncharacterized protein YecT (DUF1311 family)